MVRTVTVALSSLGYCRTLSERNAWSPAMMITRFTTIASTGRRTKMSVNFTSASEVVDVRLQRRRRFDCVVDHHARAVAQLERAGGDQLLAGLDSVGDGDKIAARATHAHELLARDLARLAVVARLVLDDEHRVTVGGVHHRRHRRGHDVQLVVAHHRDLHEHARAQLVAL